MCNYNKIIIILILFLIFLGGCSRYTFFQRISYNEESKKYVRHFFIGENEDSQDIIVEILEKYSEDYYLEDGQIYITKKLWRDKKTLYGYCKELGDREKEINYEKNKF